VRLKESAKRDDARLVIVHVDERIVGTGGGDVHPDEARIQASVRQQAEELSKQGIETTVEMRDVMVGGPAQRLLHLAHQPVLAIPPQA
jgi:nucleotide-binding universal stress UspA family protein